MNKSSVISLSLHPSGKMLLAIYDNNMLRLWNMMEARCQFKKKMGLIEDTEEPSYYTRQKGEEDDSIPNLEDFEEGGEDEQLENEF